MKKDRPTDTTRARFRTSQEYRELKEERDPFRRRMLFLGLVAKELKQKGIDAILVGGQAVDLYTAGTFSTMDIDLLVDNGTKAEKLLNRFGFGKSANGLWLNKDLAIVVQVISKPYSGDTEKIRKFKVKDYELRVAAPEDLIRNRLYSAKFWKSNPQRDIEQSVALLAIFADSIDNTYLDRIARENDITDYLAEARMHASKADMG